MPEAVTRLAADLARALVYHRGLPVAVCQVEGIAGERLQLDCGPYRLDRHTPLLLYLSQEGKPLYRGIQVNGRVTDSHDRRLVVALDEVPEGLV